MTETSNIRRSTKHEKKMLWLAENEASLEAEYPGMWAAISNEGLAAVGNSVLEAEEKAYAMGFDDVAFLLIGAQKDRSALVTHNVIRE